MSRYQMLHYMDADGRDELSAEVGRAKKSVARCVSASMVMRTALERFLSLPHDQRDAALNSRVLAELSTRGAQ